MVIFVVVESQKKRLSEGHNIVILFKQFTKEKNMNAFVIYNTKADLYLHSTKEGGTDDITCAFITSSPNKACRVYEIVKDTFLDSDWVVRSITITLN